jgi:hypothetical protein
VRRFFGLLCAHKWETTEKAEIVGERTGNHVGTIFLQRCEHCGTLKTHQVRV